MKIALLVAYDGTDFSGFARQRSARTVQGLLEEKLSMLLRAPILTTGAGRTDAGVHAWGQVVSFEALGGTKAAWVRTRVNKLLAPEITVRAAVAAPDAFDARFSARRREYEYRIYRGDAPDPFLDRFTLWVPGPLKVTSMRAAARAFVGEHDFSAFCRKGQGTLVRRVRSVSILPGAERVTLKVAADSFCHQMVRSMVGMMLDVAAGKRDPAAVATALASRDRSRAAQVAPARGLHLMRVVYPRRALPQPFTQGILR